MRREEFHSSGLQALYPVNRLRSREEILREFNTPCSRFKSIATTEETLRSFIGERMLDVDGFPSPSLVIDDGIPANWRRLLSFLHENGVTDAPRFSERYRRNDRPYIPNFELLPPRDSSSDGEPVAYGGFGGSFDPEEAMSKAVGEMLERFFLSTYQRESFRAASFAELQNNGENVIDLMQFDFFHDWQKRLFPGLRWDETSVFRWVKGYALESSQTLLIPAQIVFWNYHHGAQRNLASERMIFFQTTSGSAGHFTKDEAILSALLEAIQRDGFLIYWLNSLAPKIIDIDTVEDPDVLRLVAYIRRFGIDIVFLDTTSDFGVPSATCAIIDPHEKNGPVISIGSSAGFDVRGTLMQSAIESMVVNNYVATNEKFELPTGYRAFSHFGIGRMERLFSWRGPEMMDRFRFFISGEKESVGTFMRNASTYDSVASQLAHIRALCAKRGPGYEIYLYEIHNAVLDQLGYHVVRTIVPQLIPLYLGEFAATLNARRLKEVPEKIGYKAAKEFNPWPHPFP